MSMNPAHIHLPNQHFVRTALCLALLALPLGSLQAQGTEPDAKRATSNLRSRSPVTLNFVNADIEAVTRAIAAMIERQIAVDPRVKGSITVYSEQPQSVRDAYQNYQSALRGLGFAVVESGGLLKVVPEADAKLQTGTVSVGDVTVRGDQVITQIFSLRFESANNLVAVLRPLISANNTINANQGNNSLVITDYADNLQRIHKIIAALDVPAATDIEVIPLQHAVASDVAALVQRLSEGGQQVLVPGAAGAGGSTVMADARSNSLIVRAPNAARLAAIRNTIAKLDRPSAGIGPGGGMWVVHLKNADAVKLATVVRAAFAAVGTNSTGGGGASSGNPSQSPSTSPNATLPGVTNSSAATSPISASAQPSTGGFIQADPATNSLIITAPEPLYRQVRAMIDQLDTRRAQVYIESLIVEISGDDAADAGFQWLGALGLGNGRVQAVQSFPSGSSPGIIDINAGILKGAINVGTGLSLGLLNGANTLTAIARLIQKSGNSNIMSTPNLMTVDNEEAKIVVGRNVPFITGQFTSTGTGTTNPFQTVERKDVGITLRIKPQIGEGGTIRMTIFQESSAVVGQAEGTSGTGPTTSKRSIETNVIVDDGSILVLGGLIEDRIDISSSKVPLLGDIPGIGALFRSESRSKQRTNLMVFLRPVVLRDGQSSERLSIDRYDILRGQQRDAQPTPSVVMPINESPVLPVIKPLAEPATTAPKP